MKSSIEWTGATWNPITGCSKVSPGCTHCYAEKMSFRLKAMGTQKYSEGFDLTLHEDTLDTPLKWKKPQLIFVNSMSDLFHKDVPVWFIQRVFSVMRQAHWHQFQILTKRSKRLAELSSDIDWPENVWMGVSVENAAYKYRIADLKEAKASIRFLSIEPLVDSVGVLDLTGIDWVIVGGESGPRARPLCESWVVEIQKQCSKSQVPFFFKQWGGRNKKKAGRLLQGRTWDELPESGLLTQVAAT